MGPRRNRALLLSAVALFTASGAACSVVLGLASPTLDPCATGCQDAGVPVTDASGSSPDGDATSGGDATSAGDAVPESASADADATSDVVPDRGPSSGIRCGVGATSIFCAPPSPACCLVLDDAGAASYSCESSAAACSGYPIACATNNDCAGSSVCCFYNSAIKCEPNNTASCANALVCDPSGPSDQCPAGQTCTIAYVENGYTLPYDGCH